MLKDALKFARVRIVLTLFALLLLGAAVSGGMTPKIFIALLIVIAFTIHGNSVNDFADREIDRVNFKDATERPLVAKQFSWGRFWFLHAASGVIALLLSSFYGGKGLLVAAGVLLFNYAYSLRPIRVADWTIASPVILPISYVFSSFSLGFWSNQDHGAYPWLLSLAIYCAFVARLLLKDFRDAKGDEAYGKITFLLRYGAKTTSIASAVFWLFALVGVIIATSFSIGVALVLALGFGQAVFLLRRLATIQWAAEQQNLVAAIAKSANSSIIVLLVYYLSAQQTGLSVTEITLLPAGFGLALLLYGHLRYQNFTQRQYDAKPKTV